MQLVETKDMTEILKIIPHEVEIRQKQRDMKPLKDMLSYVKRKMESDPDFHAILAYDKAGCLIAYALFSLSLYPDDKRLDLQRIWHDSEHPNGLVHLVKAFKQLGKKYHLDTITTIVHSREMTQIAREWGFKMKGVMLERKFYNRRKY